MELEFQHPNRYRLKEEKAAAATSKPEISSEEDEIQDDNNEAKETKSPSAAAKFESSSEEAVHQIEYDSNKATKFRSHKRPNSDNVQKHAVQQSQGGAEENKGGSASNELIRPLDTTMFIVMLGIPGLMPLIIKTVFNFDRDKPQTFLEVTHLLSILISFPISLYIAMVGVKGHSSVLTLSLMCLLFIFVYPSLNPAIGMYVVQLSSHYVVGLLGYVLAQRHNMLKGKHMYKIPAQDNTFRKVARFIHILLNLGVALRMTWVFIHSLDYTPVDLMMHCLLPLIGGVLFWITFVVVSLGDTFIGDDGFALVVFYLFFIMLNYILMLVTLGDAMATLATWFAALGLSGFLGYSIRIYNFSRVTKDLGSEATSQQSSHPHSSS